MTPAATSPRIRCTKCVIWHPKGVAIDPELVGALRSKSIELSARCDNEFAALATVCLLSKAPDATESATVLLIVEPRRVTGATEIMSLMARSPFRAAVWVYDRAGSPRLRSATAREFGESTDSSWRRSSGFAPTPNTVSELKCASNLPRLVRDAEHFETAQAASGTRVDPSSEEATVRAAGLSALEEWGNVSSVTMSNGGAGSQPALRLISESNNCASKSAPIEGGARLPSTQDKDGTSAGVSADLQSPIHLLTDEELALLLASDTRASI